MDNLINSFQLSDQLIFESTPSSSEPISPSRPPISPSRPPIELIDRLLENILKNHQQKDSLKCQRSQDREVNKMKRELIEIMKKQGLGSIQKNGYLFNLVKMVKIPNARQLLKHSQEHPDHDIHKAIEYGKKEYHLLKIIPPSKVDDADIAPSKGR